MVREEADDDDEMVLDPLSRATVERACRCAYDAVHGTGSWDDLDVLKRDDAIRATGDYLEQAGAGFAPW